MSYDSDTLDDDPVYYAKVHETSLGAGFESTVMVDISGESSLSWYVQGSLGITTLGLAGPIETEVECFGASGAVGYVYVTNGDPRDLRNDQTLEAWFKSTNTGCETLINRGGDVTNNYLAVGTRSTGLFSDRLVYTVGFDGEAFGVASDVAVTTGVWHHAAAVRRGASMRVYLDGCLGGIKGGLPLGPIDSPDIDDTRYRFGYMTNLVFGAINQSAGLSHIALYDHALSAARIFEKWQSGRSALQAACPVPAGYRPSCNTIDSEIN